MPVVPIDPFGWSRTTARVRGGGDDRFGAAAATLLSLFAAGDGVVVDGVSELSMSRGGGPPIKPAAYRRAHAPVLDATSTTSAPTTASDRERTGLIVSHIL